MAIADSVMRREQAERVPAGRTARAVIEVEDLSLTFETADGPVFALAEVNLTVQAGDFVSFIAPSGCSKTTLLRVIADHERPTAVTTSVPTSLPTPAPTPPSTPHSSPSPRPLYRQT